MAAAKTPEAPPFKQLCCKTVMPLVTEHEEQSVSLAMQAPESGPGNASTSDQPLLMYYTTVHLALKRDHFSYGTVLVGYCSRVVTCYSKIWKWMFTAAGPGFLQPFLHSLLKSSYWLHYRTSSLVNVQVPWTLIGNYRQCHRHLPSTSPPVTGI